MPWVRIEDSFLTHPKAVAAGKDGRALWLAGLLYAARELTDGHVPEAALPIIAASASVTRTRAALDAITTPWRDDEAPLWETTVDGWQIHDYHDYQPSADEVLEKRRKERERKAKGRSRQGRNPATGHVTSTRNPEDVPPGIPPGQPQGQPPETRPDVQRNPRKVTPVPSPSPGTHLHAGDSHVSPTPDDDGTNNTQANVATLARLAAKARSTRLGGGHNTAWLNTTAAQLAHDHAAQLAKLADEGHTPTQIDLLLDGHTPPTPTPINPAIATATRPHCDTCDNLHWIDTADGSASPCPDCSTVHA